MLRVWFPGFGRSTVPASFTLTPASQPPEEAFERKQTGVRVMVNLNHEELLPIIKTAVAESIKGCSSAVTASVHREPTPLGQAMGSISAQILRSSEIQRETNSKLDEMAVDKALERKVMTDILKEL